MRSSHTGQEFESGVLHQLRGLNEPAPGVEVVNGQEEQSSWIGGRQNFLNESGRKRGNAGWLTHHDTKLAKCFQLLGLLET